MIGRVVSPHESLSIKFFRRHYRDDFEIDEIFPLDYPRIEVARFGRIHDLVASCSVLGDPTVDVVDIVREHAPLLFEPLSHGFRVAVTESLDDEKQHVS